MAELGILIGLLIFIVGPILLVCWIILPFAIVGTKPLLRQLIVEMRESNRLAQQQLEGTAKLWALAEKQVSASDRVALTMSRLAPTKTEQRPAPK